VIASLVRQLVDRLVPIGRDPYAALDPIFRFQKRRPDLRDLRQALSIASDSFSTTILIFDALNECREKERRQILHILGQLKTPKLKILATSRPHLKELETFFDQGLRIDITASPCDITNFLRTRLDEGPSKYSEKLKLKIVSEISESANGMY
jgi:hypothetical protein